MEQGVTQTIATFTGTLLRREHAPGQRFVQLIFRENDKDWLGVSSTLSNAKLVIGQKYRIEGVFKSLGERPYIHEPKITAAKRRLPFKRLGAYSAIVLVVAIMTAFAVHSVHGNLAPTSAESTGAIQHKVAANTPPIPTAASSGQPASTPAPATTAPVTPKAAAKKTSIPANNPPPPASTTQNTSTATTPSAPAPDTTAPTAPTGFIATVVSDGAIDLSWQAATDDVGVMGYQISRDDGTTIETAGMAYTDTHFADATTVSHAYTIMALDAAGNASTTLSFTTDIPPQ